MIAQLPRDPDHSNRGGYNPVPAQAVRQVVLSVTRVGERICRVQIAGPVQNVVRSR